MTELVTLLIKSVTYVRQVKEAISGLIAPCSPLFKVFTKSH